MRTKLYLALGLAGVFATGCSKDDGGGGGGEEAECVSDLQFFQQQISAPLIQVSCINCHNSAGAARKSNMVLLGAGETNYLRINFDTLKSVGALEVDGTSQLLLKPTEGISHGGGAQLEVGDDGYAALEGLIERFSEPVICETGTGGGGELLANVELLDLPGTLRKAKVQLIGELPTVEELSRLSAEGEPALNALLLSYLDEDLFYETLKRWWNDRLLTDKYLGRDSAVNLLNQDTYPNRRFYSDLPEDTEEGQLARKHTNASVAREPLELIAYVVRNELPFTEILTADYMMLNPFSARVYGAEVRFDDPLDPKEFKKGRIAGVPHAGLLTSPMFLNRFPTTATNRNRHRSRLVWDLFLATDILKKADRPVDPAQIVGHNPTMNNPDCAVCHAQMDPVAGAFMNWNAMGAYVVPEEGWYTNMRPPGFEDAVLPDAEWTSALQWVAQQITKDERFALSATYAVYTGMIGRPPVQNPTDESDPRYASRLAFYNIEQAFLREAMETFVASGHNLKSLIPAIALSPFYRATTAAGLTEDEEEALKPLGTTRLLTPEELHQKLVATLGYPWKRRVGDRNLLLSTREYLFFYGGIDSDNVTQRITEPNGMMANIALRMANEMACLVSPRDLKLPAADRVLFPLVEQSYKPEDDNGFEIPQSVDAIRKNIRYLHHRLLGEVLRPGDAEEEATYQLFLATWREGYAAVNNEQLSGTLEGHCRYERDFWSDESLEDEDRLTRDTQYTLRAWMAVVSYLLADWRFIYHQ